MKHCLLCSYETSENQNFCPLCGNELTNEFRCSNCNGMLNSDDKYCGNCGSEKIFLPENKIHQTKPSLIKLFTQKYALVILTFCVFTFIILVNINTQYTPQQTVNKFLSSLYNGDEEDFYTTITNEYKRKHFSYESDFERLMEDYRKKVDATWSSTHEIIVTEQGKTSATVEVRKGKKYLLIFYLQREGGRGPWLISD